MVKISGTKQQCSTGKNTSVRSASSKGAGFSVGSTSGSPVQESPSTNANGAEVAPTIATEALGALIALQTENVDRDAKHRSAERVLELMDRIRDGLLNGRIFVRDLKGLADAADAKGATGDPQLDAVFNEISLRARIELAKFGH